VVENLQPPPNLPLIQGGGIVLPHTNASAVEMADAALASLRAYLQTVNYN